MSDEDRTQEKVDQEIQALVKVGERSLGVPNRPAGISAPVEQKGVNYLVMNCVIPGLGSLVSGNKVLGGAQLALAGLGLVMLLSGHILLGLGVGFGGWLWSVLTGVTLMRKLSARSSW